MRRTPAPRCSKRSACRRRWSTSTSPAPCRVWTASAWTQIADEVTLRHQVAYPARPELRAHRDLELGGEYQWRREGEYHLFNPETVFKLQHATRAKRYDVYKEYTRLVDDQSRRLATLRGLFTFREGAREPVPIDEVEPVSEIVKRFATGAMSYGSISKEAHETLAIAMNRIGGKSNTGEGGEDADRYAPDPNGDWRRSAIKQVASGRFGVTSEYLVNADDLQIKMAQGAKPGEGGQLPGHKVYPWIARTRHSTPGVGLISPPPHHDIYSIEDIKQLIHDLKNSNPRARVHVKLVAQVGVGTVAAGVAKARSDVVLISGPRRRHRRFAADVDQARRRAVGAGHRRNAADAAQERSARPHRRPVRRTAQDRSRRHHRRAARRRGVRLCQCSAGGERLRDDARVPPGHLSGRRRDAEPGAEKALLRASRSSWSISSNSSPRKCASTWRRSASGRSPRPSDTPRCWTRAQRSSTGRPRGLDLSPILNVADNPYPGQDLLCTRTQDHHLDRALDQELIKQAQMAIEVGWPVKIDLPIHNVNRSVGTLLGSEVTRRWGGEGLPDNTIEIHLRGSAGQSFGAFVPRGITLHLEGDANDYTAKGLSGGRVILNPDRDATFDAEENIIAGNVILYGATSGEAFIRGVVGERFAVRNSGATAVVEGVGDHACEYMTGGRVVVLGPTGRNFAAGMSGGVAYVYDCDGTFPERVNPEMVDLEPLDDNDRDWLLDVIYRHRELTGSARAAYVLADWSATLRRMVKVMPRDYKRVMSVMRLAEEDGMSIDEAHDRVMVAAHG